jgi:hypothetical protein
LIQSWGNFLLSRTQAQVIWEQARALDRENDMKWRAIREQIKQEEVVKRVEGAKKLAQRRSTVYRSLYQLAAGELDRRTGQIHWPAVLLDSRYQQDRERVDELFRSHVGYGEPQPITAEAIASSINSLVRALKKDLRNVPRDEYLAGQRFLLGLKYEASSLVEAS